MKTETYLQPGRQTDRRTDGQWQAGGGGLIIHDTDVRARRVDAALAEYIQDCRKFHLDAGGSAARRGARTTARFHLCDCDDVVS